MSVLNQVLRDLERRAPAAAGLALATPAGERAPPLATLAQKAFADGAPLPPLPTATPNRWRRIAIWTSVVGFTLSVLLAMHLAEQRDAQQRAPVPLGFAEYGGALAPAAARAPVSAPESPQSPSSPSSSSVADLPPARTEAGESAATPDARTSSIATLSAQAGTAPKPTAPPSGAAALATAPAAAGQKLPTPRATVRARTGADAAPGSDTDDGGVRRSAASLADPQADIARAANLIGRGRSTEAKDLLRTVLARQPVNADARAALAALQAESGDRAQALSTLLDGAALDPLRFAVAAAQLQSELGDPQGALATLERVPPARRSGEHHALAGGLALAAQQPAAAIAAYQRALASSETKPVWWIGLGLAQEAIGDRAAAHDALARAARAPGLGEELRGFAVRRLAGLSPRDPTSSPGDAALAGLDRR